MKKAELDVWMLLVNNKKILVQYKIEEMLELFKQP